MKVGIVAGVLLALVGAAGLWRGLTSQFLASSGAPGGAGQVSVVGAYVRAPVPPTQLAAAYFTVYNTTGTADRLVGVHTGAGASAVLHIVQPDGSMQAAPGGAPVPAHGTLVLTTGKAHVMISQLYGTLAAGQTVDMELDFQNAGAINVVAPVIAPGAPAPNASSSPSGVPS